MAHQSNICTMLVHHTQGSRNKIHLKPPKKGKKTVHAKIKMNFYMQKLYNIRKEIEVKHDLPHTGLV